MRKLAAACLILALTACAERPFLDASPAEMAALKPGQGFPVCYAPGTPRAEIDAVAVEACGTKRLRAERLGVQKAQCAVTAVHKAWYTCR